MDIFISFTKDEEAEKKSRRDAELDWKRRETLYIYTQRRAMAYNSRTTQYRGGQQQQHRQQKKESETDTFLRLVSVPNAGCRWLLLTGV